MGGQRLNILTAFLLSSLILLPSPAAFADEEKTGLDLLDALVLSNEKYETEKLEAMDECRLRIASATEEELPMLYNRMVDLFYGFQSDSAFHYARQGLESARRTSNRQAEIGAMNSLANVYYITGMYMDAIDILDSLDRKAMNPVQLRNMYSSYNSVYEGLKSISLDGEMAGKYHSKAVAYKDSILALDPSNIYVLCNMLLLQGQVQEAIDKMKPYCDSLAPDDPQMGPAAFSMSDIYRKVGWREAEKEYLVASAVSDLMNANKEYISLNRLALIMYEENDIERAYAYLNRSINDAVSCQARLRIDEVAPFMAIVNDAYARKTRKNYAVLYVILASWTLLAAGMCWLVFYLRRQRRRLKRMNSELKQSRIQQEQSTKNIVESSNIKNTYITRLMLECISRIERLEQYRKGLNRKALSREYDVLQKELKSNAVVEEEWKSFYNVFDTTFLSLFPTFVADFNSLLKPEHRIEIPEKKLLSPELRIYALIRLDIDSTEKIASLLRYSRSTIYAYRSRTRLKASDPEHFEENVKKISSI